MAEGGALQAGWLGGQGLGLQLEGVTKGASSQAVECLDSNPAEDFEEMSASEVHMLFELSQLSRPYTTRL